MRIAPIGISAALLMACAPSGAVLPDLPSSGRVLIAGDSTAQGYEQDRYPQSGWGQYLACGLAPGTQVVNRAKAARSTRSFINEARWDLLMAETRPGDTILIQFGHNDAARDKPERFADPATSFRDNLLRFVWEARGRQAVPVLVTPVARRNFGTDGKAVADFPQWSAITRAVAVQTGTPLIDLEASSRALLDRIGGEGSRPLYLHLPPKTWPGFPQGLDDDTHFSELGARRIAGLVVAGLAALPIPASRLAAPEAPALTRATPLGTGACE